MIEPTVEHVSRELIEHKLLAALDDAAKAAIVMSADDLEMLIAGLEHLPETGPQQRFLVDLRVLQTAVFGG